MEEAKAQGFLNEMDDFFEERPVNDLLFAISSSFVEDRKKTIDKSLNILSRLIGDRNCIIIGRCGNYIFRNRKDLISVFLHGDIETRIQNIMNEKKMLRNEAMKFIHHTDNCRTVYHKYYTGLTWGNAADYDICIDSCRLGIDSTVSIIDAYVKQINDIRVHE